SSSPSGSTEQKHCSLAAEPTTRLPRTGHRSPTPQTLWHDASIKPRNTLSPPNRSPQCGKAPAQRLTSASSKRSPISRNSRVMVSCRCTEASSLPAHFTVQVLLTCTGFLLHQWCWARVRNCFTVEARLYQCV